MVIEKKINTASVNLKSLDPLDPSLELLHFGSPTAHREAETAKAHRG